MRRRIRRQIRRQIRRGPPKVRRCACSGARADAKERMAGAGGLLIGGAQDPAERAADARAKAALGPAPAIRRACAACAGEETRRSPASSVVAPGAAPARAPRSAEAAVKSLGPGKPLSAAERGFFEPRLGADLSAVRLHEDAAADRAAGAMDARAFTLGRDIVFARGERSRGGGMLMAHELAHAAEEAPEVRRSLRVLDPSLPIPRPGGVGLRQSNAGAVQSYLSHICPEGGATVAGDGEVALAPGTCDTLRGELGGGCDCICDLVDDFTDWRIQLRDPPAERSYPHTDFDNDERAATPGAGGTGGVIHAPSPNSPYQYGSARRSGAIVAEENWEVLLHEMCGHARRGAAGEHPRDDPRGVREGHGEVVEDVNRIRQELPGAGDDPRGTRLQDPWCGESFYRGGAATEWTPSSYMEECRRRRAAYLRRMRRRHPGQRRYRRRYDLSERLP